MGQLANAATLMRDAEFRAWVLAAGAYQAVVVIGEPPESEDHALRLRLALDVIDSPNIIVDRLLTVLAVDPEINVSTTPDEGVVLAHVATYWTPLARLVFAGEPVT